MNLIWGMSATNHPRFRLWGTMKTSLAVFTILAAISAVSAAVFPPSQVSRALNGIALPEGFKTWRVVASSRNEGTGVLQLVLWNDAAVRAAKDSLLFPDGSMLALVYWKNATTAQWPDSVDAAGFVRADFMVRDAKRFAATDGWGFARWEGPDWKPYGKDASFDRDCAACHRKVKITIPAEME
jgi:hypothetical protein